MAFLSSRFRFSDEDHDQSEAGVHRRIDGMDEDISTGGGSQDTTSWKVSEGSRWRRAYTNKRRFEERTQDSM